MFIKWLFSLFIFIAPIIFIVILKLYYKIIPGEEIGTVGDWISFSGGYIGSLMALGGIWYQIKKENKEKRKEKDLLLNENMKYIIFYLNMIKTNLKKDEEEIYYFCFNSFFLYKNKLNILQRNNKLDKSFDESLKNIINTPEYYMILKIYIKIEIYLKKVESLSQYRRILLQEEKKFSDLKILDYKYANLKRKFFGFKRRESIEEINLYIKNKVRDYRNTLSVEDIGENYLDFIEFKEYYLELTNLLFNEDLEEEIICMNILINEIEKIISQIELKVKVVK